MSMWRGLAELLASWRGRWKAEESDDAYAALRADPAAWAALEAERRAKETPEDDEEPADDSQLREDDHPAES